MAPKFSRRCLKGHSQLWGRTDLYTSFANLEKRLPSPRNQSYASDASWNPLQSCLVFHSIFDILLKACLEYSLTHPVLLFYHIWFKKKESRILWYVRADKLYLIRMWHIWMTPAMSFVLKTTGNRFLKPTKTDVSLETLLLVIYYTYRSVGDAYSQRRRGFWDACWCCGLHYWISGRLLRLREIIGGSSPSKTRHQPWNRNGRNWMSSDGRLWYWKWNNFV